MPAFSYTSGDISHLTAGGAANMTDLQGPFTDVRTALNGNLDEVNVPNLSAAFTTWKTIAWGGATIPTQGAGATLLISGGTGAEAIHSAQAVTGNGGAAWVFYLDPGDWLANARTTKLRLRAQYLGNSVAPGTNFAPALYPVTAVGGPSGSSPSITTTGALVTGSNLTFTAPAGSAMLNAASTEFNAPSAAFYCFAVVVGGVMAAGSQCIIGVQLQMRQV